MAVNIDTSMVPYGFTESGERLLADLKAFPDPEIVKDVGRSVEKLAGVTGEDAAKFFPTIFANDLTLMKDLCSTGEALKQTVKAVAKVDRKAGLAIGIGVLAIGGVYYLWTKQQNYEARIRNLEQTVHQMQNGNGNVIGF